ncbi:MAG: metal ABC transporter ATP-binding protein [Thalassobaculum sp.]|uniref:metal ABC transporter ATP-binding protein n=1 Tax=Thalassobaculum sp. TaxID=2022740 RepID=UPI0032EBB76F
MMQSLPADAPGDLLLQAVGLAVRLGGRDILHGIDLTLRRGEIVTVIGPNGGGKSTLLRAVLGLVEPSAGRARLADRVTVGYVPQRFPLDRVLPMTVGRLMRLTARPDRAAVERALAETGTAHLVDASVHALSGGELQRVLLARALVREPDILALDEPVQAVDYAGEAAMYELIAGIRDRRGCGVLMVSHDLHLVMAATDRVLCINGHVCCTGTPHEVSGNAEFRRMFGPQAGAFALYRHRHDHDHDLSGEPVAAGEGDPHHHHHHHHHHG